MSSRDGGFTLIELLIVVVIIGILAAIAIPKFSAVRERAYVAALKADLRNLASLQEVYYNGTFSFSTRTSFSCNATLRMILSFGTKSSSFGSLRS